MKKYEMQYIIAGSLEESAREDLINKVDALIKENGSVETSEKLGMKKFAYPINYKTEGFYVLVNFTAEPEFVAELDRKLRINDGIVRQMIITK